ILDRERRIARCGSWRWECQGARLLCNIARERHSSDGCHPMRLFTVILFALLTAACNQEQDVTGSTPLCPMRNYSSYNPRDMNQCVAACKSCDHGNTVTCTTACT